MDDFELTLLMEAAEPQAAAPGLLRALAGTQILLVQTRIAHWNVVGPDFPQLHKLFEGQYKELEDAIDEIAERARQCGTTIPPTLARLIENSPVPDRDMMANAQGMASTLFQGNQEMAAFWRGLAENADAATTDLAARRAGAHEKAAWMLGSLCA
jgi:starvation-inducible DNA-binding protein